MPHTQHSGSQDDGGSFVHPLSLKPTPCLPPSEPEPLPHPALALSTHTRYHLPNTNLPSSPETWLRRQLAGDLVQSPLLPVLSPLINHQNGNGSPGTSGEDQRR